MLARGEWLQYLDADDYLMPAKITQQLTVLHDNPVADIIFSPVTVEYWSQNGARREVHDILPDQDLWSLLVRWQMPQTGAVLWRKKAILDAGLWNEAQPCCQEHELYLRLLMTGANFALYRESGAVYRIWSESTVCRRNKSEVTKRRLEIKERAEAYLFRKGELSLERRRAINEARFAMARSTWQWSKAEALAIVNTIRRSDPNFRPSLASSALAYHVLYSIFGFSFAEIIADVHRNFSVGISR